LKKEKMFMLAKVKWFNVALRGLMETGLVIALGYWGFQTGRTIGVKILLGIGVPFLVFGFWGLIDFHQAGSLSEPLRLSQELVITGLAALALIFVGQPALGFTLGLVSLVHHALVYLQGDTLLKH
jgi:hypothetical protein